MKSNSMTVGKYHIINPNQERHQPLPDSHRFNVKDWLNVAKKGHADVSLFIHLHAIRIQ
ncbi:hypothetical protein CXB51_018859 [Gossypium anomalum]|uniref:Uncharacterized protein n=1 Tax=Gossypium anomalum TaxID=47600 RepID=A0A8J5YN59_9ROSI|nr:hypothetical protein CXB51_018859 [Gossypium anomalum]